MTKQPSKLQAQIGRSRNKTAKQRYAARRLKTNGASQQEYESDRFANQQPQGRHDIVRTQHPKRTEVRAPFTGNWPEK